MTNTEMLAKVRSIQANVQVIEDKLLGLETELDALASQEPEVESDF
jgi:hypothetical protein